jgi:hypothetical protein
MADEAIRKLCDGEELVLADEQRAPSLQVSREADPRAATVERRHRALAGRSPEPRSPLARPAPPIAAPR